jgi:diguanylate cyclase (GGDEF)-like protein
MLKIWSLFRQGAARRLPPAIRPVSVRALTLSYVTALLIIAGLMFTSHLLLAYVAHVNQGSASVVNFSGRQRMLSQRIASLAEAYRDGDPTARAPLISAIELFENREKSLELDCRAASDWSEPTRELKSLYFAGPDSLQAQANLFTARARAVAAMPPGAAAARAPLAGLLAQARLPLLAALDHAVSIHQAQSEQRLGELEDLQWLIFAVLLATLGVEALTIFRRMVNQIALYMAELTRLVAMDPLTELANRRGFLEACATELVRAQRYRRPLGVMLLDVDHFKKINDSYGHAAGDEVLKALAAAFRRALRASDCIGRLGGEEFAVLLPETDLVAATRLAERVRVEIAGLDLPFGEHRIKVTVSIGVTLVPPDAANIEASLSQADALMYQAKQTGRNLVVSGQGSAAYA